MKINSHLIRDTCISLREAVILVLSGCKPWNATKVYGWSLKLNFYCSFGSTCTLKAKDDNFSDKIDMKETTFVLNLLLLFTGSRSISHFYLTFLVLSSSEGCSANLLY